MAGELLNPLLAVAAGALTILSPCVLPLVPVVLGAAGQRHRLAPVALALGLVASFTSIGFALAAFGSRLGVDSDQLRLTGAIILVGAGAFLLVSRLQDLAARAANPLIGWAHEKQRRFEYGGLIGQAAIGALLGIVWTPCVGPTLGAAIALATQEQELFRAALTMAGFATGIAAMLLVIALLGQKLVTRMRPRFMHTARLAKAALGAGLAMTGFLILTGLDRILEAEFVRSAPDWLNQLTTAI